MGVVANVKPQLASTGPPAGLTTSVWYGAPGRNRDALENTSSGPVTSRIWADSKVDDDDARRVHRQPMPSS